MFGELGNLPCGRHPSVRITPVFNSGKAMSEVYGVSMTDTGLYMQDSDVVSQQVPLEISFPIDGRAPHAHV